MNNHTRAENYAWARGTSLVYRYNDDGDLVVHEGLTPRQPRRFRHKHGASKGEGWSRVGTPAKSDTARGMLRSGDPRKREAGRNLARQQALRAGHWLS